MRSETLLFNFHSGKLFSKTLLLLFFTFFNALAVQAQIIDQANTSASNFEFSEVNSTESLGQSFVAGLTGDFNEFHFLIGNYPSYFIAGDFQLKLYAGNSNTGTLLATKNFTIATYPGSNVEYAVVMPAGIAMVAGNAYTVVLQGVTGSVILNATDNTYVNGQLYYYDSFFIDYDLWFKTYITDPSGSALNFDGADDKVVFGNAINTVLDPLNTITVEAWVKTTNTSFNGVIVGNYHSPTNEMQFLLRRDENQFALWVDDGTGYKVVNSGVATVTLNTWQHVAGVWDGSSLYIYIDGVLKATTTGVTGSSFASTNNAVQMGSDSYSTPESFTGSVDEVRIWTRALGQCEIQNNMNGELPSGQVGLLAYYQFNHGIASENNAAITGLTDASGNNYNGTLTNFALNGATSNWVSPGGVAIGSASPVYTPPNVNAVTSQAVCNNFLTTPVVFSSSTTGTVCGTTGENGSVTLTAPAGAVFTSIPFASYGMPDGSCGNYTIGWCHATNSVATVSGLALGQNNVSIPATNGMFGDPCSGTVKRLYVEAVYDNTVFNWTNDTPSIGLAASGTGSIPSFTSVNAGSTPIVATITVTPTTANGCPGTPIQFTITVNPTLVAPTAVSQEFCDSATVTDLVATGTSLQWYADAIGGSALTSTASLSTNTYYVTSTNATGCESLRTAVSVTITPSTTNAATASACDSYTWAVNGTTYSTSGTYTSVTGCHTEILDLTINSAAMPTGNATQTFSVDILAEATIEDLDVSPVSVVWYATSDDATAGTNALPAGTQIVDGATYYGVNYENTCSSIPFEVTVTVTLGTDNFDVSGFKYYPNPTSGMLTISNSKEISEITVINLLGQTLFTKKANALEVQVDLSSLPMATYLINIVSEGQTKTIKVLKRE